MTQTKKELLEGVYDFILLQRSLFYFQNVSRKEHNCIVFAILIPSLFLIYFIAFGMVVNAVFAILCTFFVGLIFRAIIANKLRTEVLTIKERFMPWYSSKNRIEEEKIIFREYIKSSNYRELFDFDEIDKEILMEISAFNSSTSKNLLITMLSIIITLFLNYISNFNNSNLLFSLGIAFIVFYFGLLYFYSKRKEISKLISVRRYL